MLVMKKTLVVRADASALIGAGHLMRCLALAQAWQDARGCTIFVMATEAPALEARLRSEAIDVVHFQARPGGSDDATQTAALSKDFGTSWVVVDGYHFGTDYQRIIKDSGLHLLAIDDNGQAEHYCADIVLNQNFRANECLYSRRESYTRLLLGSRYALLRREFLKWCGYKPEIPEVARRVLVTLGGGDPNNLTLKVIQALPQVVVDGLKMKVVVGGANAHHKSLEAAVHDSRLPIRLERNVTNMSDLMAWADVAIAAGGSTCWELAFMGLPSALVILAENQRPIPENLDAAGMAVNLGWQEGMTSDQIAQALQKLMKEQETRKEMSEWGQKLVDGTGGERVIEAMMLDQLTLRPVQEQDCEIIWKWANDPEIRSVSFSSEPIFWEEHVRWFKAKLNDPGCIFYVSLNSENDPIGQVLYDVEGDEAIVSISMDRRYRGKGYGSMVLWLSVQKLFDVSDVGVIHAYVKEDNESSVRAFVKAGFRDIGKKQVRDHQATHLILQKHGLI